MNNQNKTNDLILWYNNPAKNWNEALPIGNGRLGGMVFGTICTEQIQLNEESIWYGKPLDRNNPHALENLPEIRRLLFEGKIKDAEYLCVNALSGTPESQRAYQTLGDLFILFDHKESNVSNYRRELDIQNAVSLVSYDLDGINYKREYFVSSADQSIIMRFSSKKK